MTNVQIAEKKLGTSVRHLYQAQTGCASIIVNQASEETGALKLYQCTFKHDGVTHPVSTGSTLQNVLYNTLSCALDDLPKTLEEKIVFMYDCRRVGQDNKLSHGGRRYNTSRHSAHVGKCDVISKTGST